MDTCVIGATMEAEEDLWPCVAACFWQFIESQHILYHLLYLFVDVIHSCAYNSLQVHFRLCHCPLF